MPFIKISGLTTATAVSATNQFEINQNGGSRSATVAQVAAFARTSATEVVILPAGSVSAPSLTFTGDTNTGIYSPAADTIAFTEGGVEAMRIDGAGRLGLGTSSPSTKMTIADAGEAGTRYLGNGLTSAGLFVGYNSAAYIYNDSNTPMIFGTNAAERMRIDASGNVGIGTSSPVARLRVSAAAAVNAPVLGNVTNYPAFISNNDATYGLGIGTAASDGHVWLQAQRSDSATSYNITLNEAGGNVGIGTTTPTAVLDVNGNVAITGTARRITGDFSNATLANRLAFQDSTLNGATGAFVLPNGTATTSSWSIYNNSNPTNSGFGGIRIDTAEFQIRSSITGSGSYVPMVLQTGGSERMRIDTSGNVGIGTSSPAWRLTAVGGSTQISPGTSAQEGIRFTRSTGVCTINGINNDNNAYNALSFATGASEAMRIDTSGNVGIGTSSPGAKLNVYTGSATNTFIRSQNTLAFADFGPLSNGTIYGPYSAPASGTSLIVGTSNSTPTTFWTNAAERARITSGGQFQFATTAFSGGVLNVGGYQDGGLYGVIMRPSANNSTPFRFENAAGSEVGTISCTTTNTNYVTSSDYRLKENIVPLTGAAARVQALKPSRFNFIADPDRTVDGFLAHEAAEVVPEAVIGEKDAVNEDGSIKPQGIDHSKLVPLLTAALQEALTEITALKARVAALENK